MTNPNTTHETAAVDTAPVGDAPAKKKGGAKKEADVKTQAVRAPEEESTEVLDLAIGKDTSHSTPMVKLTHLMFPPFEGRAAKGVITKEFQDSIAKDRIKQPIQVVAVAGKPGFYWIIDGRRRARAAEEAGLKEVPIVIDNDVTEDKTLGLSATQVMRLQSIGANLERSNLSAWDLYSEFSAMIAEGTTQSQIAKKLHKSDSFVSQHMLFSKLDKRVQTIIKNNSTDSGIFSKARALAKINDYGDSQFEMAQDAFNKEAPWTVGQLQEHVDTFLLKLAEKAKQEEQRAKEKERAKKLKAKGKDEGDAEAEADDDAEEVPTSKFAAVEITPTTSKTIIRKYLMLVELHMNKAKMLDDSDPKKAEKVAYEKGRLDALQHVGGLKDLPKSVIEK